MQIQSITLEGIRGLLKADPGVDPKHRRAILALCRGAKETEQPQLQTVREYAKMLRVSTRTVRRWADEGRIKVHRVARTVRIDAEEIDSPVAAREIARDDRGRFARREVAA